MTTSYKDLVRMVDPILFFFFFFFYLLNGRMKREILAYFFLGEGCVLLSSFSNLNRISIYLLAPAPAYPTLSHLNNNSLQFLFTALDPGPGD